MRLGGSPSRSSGRRGPPASLKTSPYKSFMHCFNQCHEARLKGEPTPLDPRFMIAPNAFIRPKRPVVGNSPAGRWRFKPLSTNRRWTLRAIGAREPSEMKAIQMFATKGTRGEIGKLASERLWLVKATWELQNRLCCETRLNGKRQPRSSPEKSIQRFQSIIMTRGWHKPRKPPASQASVAE